MSKRTGPNKANQNQMSSLKGRQQQSIKHDDGSLLGNDYHIESANKMRNHFYTNN